MKFRIRHNFIYIKGHILYSQPRQCFIHHSICKIQENFFNFAYLLWVYFNLLIFSCCETRNQGCNPMAFEEGHPGQGGVWEFADLECPWSNVSVTGFIFLTIHILCSQPHPLNFIKALKHPIYLFLFHIHITTPQIHLHFPNNHRLFIITLVSGSTFTIRLQLPLHSYSIPAHWYFCIFLYFWSLYHSTQIFEYVYMK